MPRPVFVRVRLKEGGHELDIAESAFRADAHVLLDNAKYPPSARPRPMKFRTDKAGKAITQPKEF